MEKCYYNGKIIYAIDYKEDYEKLKEIKFASRNKELTCFGCGKTVFFQDYHDRAKHFARQQSEEMSNCDYHKYEQTCKKRSPIWKESKNVLFNHFREFDLCDVDMDEKIIPNHWTDIIITFSDNEKHAIEIIDTKIDIKSLQNVIDEYKLKNINSTWFILDQINNIKLEKDAHFIKRMQLNEFDDLIIIDKDDLAMAIYKFDKTIYKYQNREGYHNFNTNIFSYPFNLEQLKISDKQILVEGFDDKYQKWLDNRTQYFLKADVKPVIKMEPDHKIKRHQINISENNKVQNENSSFSKIKHLYNNDEKIIEKNVIYELGLLLKGNNYAKNTLLELMKFNVNYVRVIKEMRIKYRDTNEIYIKLITKIIDDYNLVN